MNTKLVSYLSFFRGRRSLVISLAISLVLGTALGLLTAESLRASMRARGAGDLTGHDRLRVHPAGFATTAKANDANHRFITLNPGDTVDFAAGPVSFGSHAELMRRIGVTWKFRAVGTGHAVLTVGRGKARHPVYLFVSPVPSRHVSRDDIDWYRTQFGTGIANCGRPSCPWPSCGPGERTFPSSRSVPRSAIPTMTVP